MYWHFILFALVPVSIFMMLHYRVLLYNKRRNTSISWQQYMSKFESVWLLFPVLKSSIDEERQELIRKINFWTALFWIGGLGGLLVTALEFMP